MKPEFRDVEHLLRVAGLFLAGIVLFLVLRAALVPADFGVYGHYRAGAIAANRDLPVVHAGQEACAACHDDVVTARAAARHVTLACEGCHGAAAAHVQAPNDTKPALPDSREICVRCHAAKTGKPRWYRTVDVMEHAGDEACITCHRPHDPRLQ